MPNWCSNTISIRGSDQKEIQRLAKAFNEDEFLNAIIPVPDCLLRDDPTPEMVTENIETTGYSSWYDFCVDKWGTKWDIRIGGEADLDEDGLGFTGYFDTAWGPPIAAMNKLVEDGFEVTLYYYETGLCFVGKYEDGLDEYYDYSDENSETVRELIGEELDDYFGVSDSLKDWEDEDED